MALVRRTENPLAYFQDKEENKMEEIILIVCPGCSRIKKFGKWEIIPKARLQMIHNLYKIDWWEIDCDVCQKGGQ